MNSIVLRYAIGWTGRDPEKRYVGIISPEKPWPVFIEDVVMKDIEWLKGKVKPRVQFHNPFGVVAQWPTMRATQYRDAVRAKLLWLAYSFQAPIKKLVKQGVEVISYLGSPVIDPYYISLINNPYSNTQDNIVRELWISYKASINAGCSIGFDASQKCGPDHYQFHFMKMLKSLGVRTYIEATPQIGSGHLWSWDSIIRETTFLKRHVTRPTLGYQTRFPAYMNPDWYTCDEIHRLVLWRDAEKNVKKMVEMVRKIIEDNEGDGQSVASFDARQLIDGASIDDIVYTAND